MLGDYTWGDVHHPGLSQTDGKYDGRWLFVNDNANNRVARIDLRDFKTRQILGPIPNSSGNHGSSFVTENTEYVLVATRFSVPLPKGRYAEPSKYETEFNGMVSGLKVDPATGTLSVGWQILTPPFNWDLGSTGKGPSSGWAFWTSYNSRDGVDVARGQLDPPRSRLRGDRQLARGGAGGQGRQGDDDGRRAGARSGEGAGRAVLPAGSEVAARHRHRSVGPLDRRRRASCSRSPSVFDFEKIQAAIDAKQFDQ